MLNRKALSATAGAPKVFVEDVFSCTLYTGDGSTQTITNGIDLSGEGGLVWLKGRSGATDHALYDTTRGATKDLVSNSTAAETTQSTGLTAFSGTGFSLGALAKLNTNAATYASWTFRKAEKFFDVVTYNSGPSGTTGFSHNLGSVPGTIIFKKTSNTSDWFVYHRSLGDTKWVKLNTTDAETNFGSSWITVTSTTVSTINLFGANSDIVAYLFAHDAGGFGDAGTDNVISCGSFTTNGSGLATIDLGYEPQWVLHRQTDADNWILLDTMRGFSNSTDSSLQANNADAENTGTNYGAPFATGFTLQRAPSVTGIYIAIRRGPMKTPTTGTSVFSPTTYTGNGATGQTITSVGFPLDFVFDLNRDSLDNKLTLSRLTADNGLYTNNDDGQNPLGSTAFQFDVMTGFKLGNSSSTNGNGTLFVAECFRRAPGFFDVVCYTGTGSATTVSHNLGVAPELMIVKRRGTANAWAVYANNDNTDYLVLNTTAATVDDNTYWNDTSPTSSVFSVGTNNATNASGSTYVAYLFASLSGVSKIGTYTGNGSSVTVTTNFQPRFILVKRTDSTGNWIVGDSVRGLVAGNDPYLLLNSTAAEDTDEDWVDITSTSFTVNQTTAANANVNTGTYIYLAIA